MYGVDKNEIFLANGYESLTVTDDAAGTGTTVAKARAAYKAFMTAETAEMRFRFDGTAPSATEGHVIDAGDTLELYGTRNIINFKAIKTGETSGILRVTYYGL